MDPAATVTTITSDDPDPSIVGEEYTVTFTVAAVAPGAGTPTGNVTVSDGMGNICVGTVVVGQCVLTSTMVGALTLEATYAGDGNSSSSSDTEPHQVDGQPTTTTIDSDDPDPTVVGELYTVNFTVAPGAGTPTGDVTVSDGTDECVGTLTVANDGVGSCPLSSTTAGAKTLTATYAGDANSMGSTSDGVAHQVDPAGTTTTITGDDPDPSVVGEAYTVTFTVVPVAPGAGTPTGNVTVTDGTDSCVGTVAVGSCSLTSTTAGAKTLVATYAGDGNFLGSTSAEEPHQVDPAATVTTITSDDPDPSVVGQAYAVTFTVAAVAPGAGTPTGDVTVSDGTDECVATLALADDGVGGCDVASTTAGAKTLTATYAGDGNLMGSTSAGDAHQVDRAATTTTIPGDDPDPSVAGEPYTVTFSVDPVPPGVGTPTGNVTVTDGTDSCVETVAAGQCELVSTTAGPKTLVATYAGDGNFMGSTSAGVAHEVDPAPPTTAFVRVTPAGASISGAGASTTFTAHALSSAGDTISGKTFTWEHLNPNVATVTALDATTAQATAVASGQATVSATVDGETGYALLTVETPGTTPVGGWTAMPIPTQSGILGIWGCSPTDVFAVGGGGTILRFDGAAWSSMTSPTSETLHGVWGTSCANVYAVGAAGTIVHFDGTWSTITTGTVTDQLRAVWGSSPTDVFAVGDNGTIWHFDGSVWSDMNSGTTAELDDVWGTSSNNVFAVGSSGTILRFDGNSWGPMNSGSIQRLAALWGTDTTDIYAVGAGNTGQILRFDGTDWTASSTGATSGQHDIWGASSGEMYVPWDFGVLQFDGATWDSVPCGCGADVVWGFSVGEVYVDGPTGRILVGTRGAVSNVISPSDTTLTAIGDTVALSAEVLDASANALEGRSFIWSSSDEIVATVDAEGVATAVGNGTATITATSGGVSGAAEVTVSAPPAAPSNLSATAISVSQIDLTWTDNATNEDGSRIERCQGVGCENFEEIATVDANVTAYTDEGLSADTRYNYQVAAFNAIGSSAYSNTAGATTSGTLADGLDSPWDIAINAQEAFWVEKANPGAVRSVPIVGGIVRTLSSGLEFPTAIAVDESSVYWLEFGATLGTGSLKKVPISGGSVTTLATALFRAQNNMALDASYVYFVDGPLSPDAAVLRVPKAGGTVTTLVSSGSNGIVTMGTAIATDSAFVYFWDDATTIMRVPVSGGTPSAVGTGEPSAMILSGGTLYWVECGTGLVKSMPTDGGSVTTLASGSTCPAGLTVDASDVYWIEFTSPGTVRKVPVGGGSVTTISNEANTIGVAVDNTSVYWAVNLFANQGKIRQASK
ncbi:MAG TPA: Ig-like domain repeat protein [Gemmatimonadales bacterium]